MPKRDGSPTKGELRAIRAGRKSGKKSRSQGSSKELLLWGKNVADEHRRERVIRRKIEGWSTWEIARSEGCSFATVKNDINICLDRLVATTIEDARQLREIELGRCDAAMRKLFEQLSVKKLKPNTVVQITTAAMTVLDKRARLLGLYAPTRSEVSGPEGAPIELEARHALLDQVEKLLSREAGEGESGAAPGDNSEPEPGAGESTPV